MIDLDAIADNVRYFRQLVSAGTCVIAVVKADGYGHGAVAVARSALGAGASQLAVATVDEGVALRVADIEAPVLVLGPIDPSEVGLALERRLTLALADARFAAVVGRVAGGLGGPPAPVHVKVDTGMHRFGVAPADALDLATAIASQPSLSLVGVFTHFADADGVDEANTRHQSDVFEAVVGRLVAGGVDPGVRHAANSAAALRWRRYDFDAVRIGIALYGLPPSLDWSLPAALRPAMRVVSRVARVSALPEGQGVSYGLTYRAPAQELIGLVPVGYGDGVPRALSNRGWMGLAGRRAPIRGRVCMDQTTIGLPMDAKVRVGDLVEVMGGLGPSLAEVARTSGTIAYEIAVGLSRRVPREYVRNDRSTGS